MKRIGILTIWQSGNYGAELQAYALQKKLNLAGFDAEVIDYPFYKNSDFQITPKGKSPFSIGWQNRLKERLLPWLRQLQSWMHPFRTRQRQRNFDRFYQLTKHSAGRYLSFDQLYNEKSFGYDVYVAGSDQIWNPRTYASIEPYFLTFAPASAVKLSYAASFGVSTLPATTWQRYKAWMEQLDVISVREADAIKMVSDISGKSATLVVDPTMLLDQEEWRKVAVKPDQGAPYLLLYDVTPSLATVVLAKRIATQNNWRIIRICPDSCSRKIAGVENIYTAGPAEFIGLIDGASFVVTNSFHGSVFSILFEKTFFTVKPATTKNSGRLSNLLHLLSLTDRLILSDQVQHCALESSFRYTNQQERLTLERKKSLDFLANAMEKQK